MLEVNTLYIYLAQVLHLNFDRRWGCERNLSETVLMSVYWWLAPNFIKNLHKKGEMSKNLLARIVAS